jgi:hypothetical protein
MSCSERVWHRYSRHYPSTLVCRELAFLNHIEIRSIGRLSEAAVGPMTSGSMAKSFADFVQFRPQSSALVSRPGNEAVTRNVRGPSPFPAKGPLTCTFLCSGGSVLVQDIPDWCLATCRNDVSGDPGLFREPRVFELTS